MIDHTDPSNPASERPVSRDGAHAARPAPDLIAFFSDLAGYALFAIPCLLIGIGAVSFYAWWQDRAPDYTQLAYIDIATPFATQEVVFGRDALGQYAQAGQDADLEHVALRLSGDVVEIANKSARRQLYLEPFSGENGRARRILLAEQSRIFLDQVILDVTEIKGCQITLSRDGDSTPFNLATSRPLGDACNRVIAVGGPEPTGARAQEQLVFPAPELDRNAFFIVAAGDGEFYFQPGRSQLAEVDVGEETFAFDTQFTPIARNAAPGHFTAGRTRYQIALDAQGVIIRPVSKIHRLDAGIADCALETRSGGRCFRFVERSDIFTCYIDQPCAERLAQPGGPQHSAGSAAFSLIGLLLLVLGLSLVMRGVIAGVWRLAVRLRLFKDPYYPISRPEARRAGINVTLWAGLLSAALCIAPWVAGNITPDQFAPIDLRRLGPATATWREFAALFIACSVVPLLLGRPHRRSSDGDRRPRSIAGRTALLCISVLIAFGSLTLAHMGLFSENTRWNDEFWRGRVDGLLLFSGVVLVAGSLRLEFAAELLSRSTGVIVRYFLLLLILVAGIILALGTESGDREQVLTEFMKLAAVVLAALFLIATVRRSLYTHSWEHIDSAAVKSWGKFFEGWSEFALTMLLAAIMSLVAYLLWISETIAYQILAGLAGLAAGASLLAAACFGLEHRGPALTQTISAILRGRVLAPISDNLFIIFAVLFLGFILIAPALASDLSPALIVFLTLAAVFVATAAFVLSVRGVRSFSGAFAQFGALRPMWRNWRRAVRVLGPWKIGPLNTGIPRLYSDFSFRNGFWLIILIVCMVVLPVTVAYLQSMSVEQAEAYYEDASGPFVTPARRQLTYTAFRVPEDPDQAEPLTHLDIGFQLLRSRQALAAAPCGADTPDEGAAPRAVSALLALRAGWTQLVCSDEQSQDMQRRGADASADGPAAAFQRPSALDVPAVQDDFLAAYLVNVFGIDIAVFYLMAQTALIGLNLWCVGLLLFRTAPWFYDRVARFVMGLSLLGITLVVALQFLLSWSNIYGLLPIMGQPMTFLSAGNTHLVVIGGALTIATSLSFRLSEFPPAQAIKPPRSGAP